MCASNLASRRLAIHAQLDQGATRHRVRVHLDALKDSTAMTSIPVPTSLSAAHKLIMALAIKLVQKDVLTHEELQEILRSAGGEEA
jgi:hypothetical protein